MPYIEFQSIVDTESFDLGIYLDAELDPILGLPAGPFVLGIVMTATMYVDAYFGTTPINFGIDISADSLIRLTTTEANIFLEAEASLGLDLETNITSVFEFLAVFSLGLDMVADNSAFSEAEVDELILIVDIYPALIVPANYQEYKVRFKIDDVEVPIESFNVKAAPNKIGTDVSVVLSRLTDKSLVLATSIYELELGITISGSTTWYLLASGNIVADSYSIGFEHNSPTDSFQLSSSASLSNRINVSPFSTTVIYDSNDLTLTPSDFVPVVDVGGGIYPVILLPIGGLTLYSVLNIVFSACGLTFSTNIPNFRVKRIDIEIGQSYFQAVSGLFGAYEPIILERNGVVYILDSTLLEVPGFGAAKTLTASKYKSLSTDRTFSDINGFIVNYVESHEAWDTTDEITDETNNEVIDYDENRITYIYTRTTIKQYKRQSLPGIVVRSEVTEIFTQISVLDPVIYGTDPRLINETTETFEYDVTGKVLTRIKNEWAQIPMWIPSVNPASADGDGFWEYRFRSVRFERDDSEYKDNPNKHGTQYREIFSQIARALIYIDSDLIYETKDESDILDIDPDKEVPVDYKQEYVVAARSGNLQDDGILEYGPVMSRFEKVTPITKDFSRVETKEVDFLTNIVTVNTAEEQVGEIATTSQVGIVKRAIVYAPGGTRDARRLETINIGEIPIAYGIPLAQRKLIRAQSRNVQMAMEVIGVDLSIQRGSTIKAVGRNSEVLGNFLIEGYGITGKRLGTIQQSIMTTLDGVKM